MDKGDASGEAAPPGPWRSPNGRPSYVDLGSNHRGSRALPGPDGPHRRLRQNAASQPPEGDIWIAFPGLDRLELSGNAPDNGPGLAEFAAALARSTQAAGSGTST